MELGPELQGTLITLLNAVVSMVIFKIKSTQGKAAASKRRADAVCAAVDEALADGDITPKELKRIQNIAARASGAPA